jgi:hypothetical protein
MKLNIVFVWIFAAGIFSASCSASAFFAPCPGSGIWGCTDDWQLSFSVPAIKLQQGEKARIFEGIAAGIQLNNLFSRTETSLLNAVIITPAFMLSTATALDTTTGNRESEYVFSGALLFGIRQGKRSFQIGASYDLMSSEDRSSFDAREKTSILFTVGTGL